jgi:hypothetical protein
MTEGRSRTTRSGTNSQGSTTRRTRRFATAASDRVASSSGAAGEMHTQAAPGGGHQFYTRTDREADSGSIPTIGNGMDVQAITGLLFAQIQAHHTSHGFSLETPFKIDADEMNRRLAELDLVILHPLPFPHPPRPRGGTR